MLLFIPRFIGILSIHMSNNTPKPKEFQYFYQALLEILYFWIFLCDEIALPEIWKSDVRKVEIILCEFTRVKFYLNRIPLS